MGPKERTCGGTILGGIPWSKASFRFRGELKNRTATTGSPSGSFGFWQNLLAPQSIQDASLSADIVPVEHAPGFLS